MEKNDELEEDLSKIKGEGKYNYFIRIIKHIIKTIIVPMLIKFLAIVGIVFTIVSLITIFITVFDMNNNAEALSSDNIVNNGNYVVYTEAEGHAPVLDKEQLESVIEERYTGEAKENLLSAIEGFVYIQNEYSVNAVFAIAVTEIESSCGTNWSAIAPETHNWMSVSGSYNGKTYKSSTSSNPLSWRVYESFEEATKDFGDLIANDSYYFKAGKYDVNAIAPTYCNEEWGNSVNDIMTAIYKAAGIEISASGGKNGELTADGLSTFIDSQGRTYIEYNQTKEEYKSISLCHTTKGATLKSAGCALTSVAIIGSGFGSTDTPVEVRNYCKETNSACYHIVNLKHVTGLNWTKDNNATWAKIANTLKNGYPVMVAFKGQGKILTTSNEHRIAVLALSDDGSQVYISDPSNDRADGWQNICDLKDVTLIEYFRVVE